VDDGENLGLMLVRGVYNEVWEVAQHDPAVISEKDAAARGMVPDADEACDKFVRYPCQQCGIAFCIVGERVREIHVQYSRMDA
jgi:hypothetical protein